MRVSVVGLGKIGLPLAVQFARAGYLVSGVDVDPTVVARVNAGEVPFPGEQGLKELLPELTISGSIEAFENYEPAIPESDVVVMVVPLVVDGSGQPDFRALDSATRSVGALLKKNTLVIYETTLPIGATRNRWKPMLEVESGWLEGQDFHIVFSPERVSSGGILEDLKRYPKLIGCLGPEGANRARQFYEAAIDFVPRPDLSRGNGVWDLGSPEAAEMAKLAETTYRDANIALANQFALHSHELGLDVYDVIEACNSQPFSHIHQPGISVGGHCIPVYPHLYLSSGLTSPLISEARELNQSMPAASVKLLKEQLGSLGGRSVCVLGVSYRAGVKEDAFSGAHMLRQLFEIEGASVCFVDPLYSAGELRDIGFTPCEDFSAIGVVVLHTPHNSFSDLSDSLFPSLVGVLDGRNFLDPSRWASAVFLCLGRG